MQSILLVLMLSVASQPKVSVSLAAPVDPALTRKHDQIASKLSPTAKLKLHTIATSFKTMNSITDGTSRAAIVSAFPGTNLGDADIDALTIIIMMEASKSANEDLKAIMDEVKKINEQKSALRKTLTDLGKPPSPSKRAAPTTWRAVPVDYYRAPAPLPANADVTQIEKRFDDLEGYSTVNQLKLQQMMDKKGQYETMLSNISKKVSDTSSSIIQNLK